MLEGKSPKILFSSVDEFQVFLGRVQPSGFLPRKEDLATGRRVRPEGEIGLGQSLLVQRMTAAWWEDDEIECVWLGEGRIEHKPVLRKITIFSRSVELLLPNM